MIDPPLTFAQYAALRRLTGIASRVRFDDALEARLLALGYAALKGRGRNRGLFITQAGQDAMEPFEAMYDRMATAGHCPYLAGSILDRLDDNEKKASK